MYMNLRMEPLMVGVSDLRKCTVALNNFLEYFE